MFTCTDQIGATVIIENWPPQRIVSLVPSQTELLHYLGLEKEVVGITKFCVHPAEWFRKKKRIGGTKNVHIERVKALQPDLIIANKEENVKEQVQELRTIAPVWVSDVDNLHGALEMIQQVGMLVNRRAEAKKLVTEIKAGFKRLMPAGKRIMPVRSPRMAYLIWRKPYMTVGGDTFIGDMLRRCGFDNIFDGFERYPQIQPEVLSFLGCRLILLSSEPFPFEEKHAEELRQALPGVKVILVDGEMFSWYGSRLLKAAEYFDQDLDRLIGL